MSVFTGGEGRFIPLSESDQLISNFRKANPDHAHAFFYGCELFYDLLEEPGCKGIRIYYAQDENGEPKMVLVGVRENGQEIRKRAKNKSFFRKILAFFGFYRRRKLRDDQREIDPVGGIPSDHPGTADNGRKCPPHC